MNLFACEGVCVLPKTALQSSIQLLVIHSLICLFAHSCVHLFHKSSAFLILSFIFPAFRSLVPHVPPYVHSGYIIWTNEASKSDDLSVATSLATSGKSFSPVLGTAGLATWSSFSSKVPTSSVCFHTTLSQSISRILKETCSLLWNRRAKQDTLRTESSWNVACFICFFSRSVFFLIESRSCFAGVCCNILKRLQIARSFKSPCIRLSAEKECSQSAMLREESQQFSHDTLGQTAAAKVPLDNSDNHLTALISPRSWQTKCRNFDRCSIM